MFDCLIKTDRALFEKLIKIVEKKAKSNNRYAMALPKLKGALACIKDEQ